MSELDMRHHLLTVRPMERSILTKTVRIIREVQFREVLTVSIPDGADPEDALIFVRAALAIAQPLGWQEDNEYLVRGEPQLEAPSPPEAPTPEAPTMHIPMASAGRALCGVFSSAKFLTDYQGSTCPECDRIWGREYLPGGTRITVGKIDDEVPF